MTVKTCQFSRGVCIHCKSTEQGECEGWVPSDREQFMDEIAVLRAERDVLRKAAQAVIDRWDTPLWKDVPATAKYINELREALK